MKLNKKSLSIILAMNIVAGLFMFTSCKKEKVEDTKNEDIPVWISTGNSSIKDAIKNFVKEPKTASIPMTGGTIESGSIKVIFPADLFANNDGTPFNGTANIKLFTALNSEDMINNYVSTISDSGDLLISSGMFKIEATDGSNNKLKVRSGASYTAEIATPYNIADKVFKGIIKNGTGNQVSWDAWPNTGVKRGPGNSILTGLDQFDWCNLDRYMNETPLTDISISCPATFTNANTEVFMKYTGENTGAYIPANPTLQKFSTQGSYYKVVQGRGCKIMAFAKKGTKYYYSIQTIPSIGANQMVTVGSMTETTENDLKTQIANF